MKPFETLTYAGQLKRLKVLAAKALQAYAVQGFHLTALPHSENTNFRVDVVTGERYALRIHRPNLRTEEAVRSEMMWLAALRQETDLVVPEPTPTRDGNLLTVASIEEVPEPRICVLFRWIPGRFFDDKLTPSHLERVGTFMARLQLYGAQFRRPAGFARGRLDNLTDKARHAAARDGSEAFARQQIDNPTDEAAAIRLVTEICSTEDGERVERLIRKIREAQRIIGQGPDTFGLIHGDLHQENYLFHKDGVQAIDFDDCGFGYYLYDLAVTLSEVNWRENTPALRQGLLGGYRSVRALSPEHEQYPDTFIAFRDLQLMISNIEMRDHPAFRDGWAASVKVMLQDVKDFVER